MTLRLSVIIRTFNRAHYLGTAIDSVLAQTFRDLRIVVDDGSIDATPAVLDACYPAVTDARLRGAWRALQKLVHHQCHQTSGF